MIKDNREREKKQDKKRKLREGKCKHECLCALVRVGQGAGGRGEVCDII